MASPLDLTTLANAKAWLGITGSTDDLVLTRLITATSGFVQRWLSRQIAVTPYAERLDGQGNREIMFRHYPAVSVQSLAVNGTPKALSSDGIYQAGYAFTSKKLWLVGDWFTRGIGNVQLTYKAGFMVGAPAPDYVELWPADSFTVSGAAVATTSLSQHWTADLGVSYSTGVAMVKVASAPAVGQYTVDASGNYGFNATDNGQTVAISYSYVPIDIEQATIELLSLRFKERNRIGEVSKTLAGNETVSFSQKDMSDDIKTLLQQYKQVVF